MDFKPTVCIYHADCMDGFTAAYQVWQRYSYEIRFIGAAYGDRPPYGQITDADDVIIVDFSYPEKEMREIARRSRRVLVLDHHKTAQEALGKFNAVETPSSATLHMDFEILGGHSGQLKGAPPSNLLVCFDMERSGAMMAWDFCWTGLKPTKLVSYVQDRDLWRFKLNCTKGIHLYLTTRPMLFQEWKSIETDLEEDSKVQEVGEYLLDYHNMIIRKIVDTTGAVKPFFSYQNVAVGAAPYMLASDVGHELLNRYPGADFAAVMVVQSDKVTWSLRSENHRHDVSQVAKLFGGGGHRNAAGFRADG